MNVPRHRAWQFTTPSRRPAVAVEEGIHVDHHGVAMVEERGSIRQAIRLLISTVPGERVMRPDYGCELHRVMFAPNDDTTAGLAIHYVRLALQRWEPRIDILHLDAGRHAAEPGRLDVVLQYRARATRDVENLTLVVRLDGGPA